MFELFIALFGSAYYEGKYISDKSKSSIANQKQKELIRSLQSDSESWEREVIDEKLEYKISRESENVLCDMMIRIHKETGVGINDIPLNIVIAGAMAKYRKIPKEMAMFGIQSRGVYDEEEKKRWREQRKLMLWYDNELRQNGFGESMLFVKAADTNLLTQFMELAIPVTKSTTAIRGVYFWAPMRWHVY